MMGAKRCRKCEARFSGGFLETLCAACKRQATIFGVMPSQASSAPFDPAPPAELRPLPPTPSEPASSIHPNTEVELPDTAALERQVQALNSSLSYAQALHERAEETLRQHAAEEQRRLENAFTEQTLRTISRAMACIESKGAPSEVIDSRRGIEAKAYALSPEQTELDGVASVYRWHNMLAAERMLIEGREALSQIAHLPKHVTHESLYQRIEGMLSKARTQGQQAAQQAVHIIEVNRTWVWAGTVAFSFTLMALLSFAIPLVWPFVVFMAFPYVLLPEWGKAAKPLDYEVLTQGTTSPTRVKQIWLGAGAWSLVCAIVIIVNLFRHAG